MPEIVLRVAAKAVIVNDKNEVLIVREANTYSDSTQLGKYTLPGGRINLGEKYFDGLKREISEEVGLEIEPVKPIEIGEWYPEINGVKNQIIAIFYLCKAKNTDIKLSEEHDSFAWVNLDNLQEYSEQLVDENILKQYFNV